MANEMDFKKIELKVSANCCEGCKRKVKKALRNLEGVLNIDIDPMEPKITVLGNVNPHILIKRLQKVGKRAELVLWSYEEAVEAEEIKEEITKQDSNTWEQEKQPHPHHDFKIEKTKDVTSKKKKGSKDDNKMMNSYNACSTQEKKKEEHYLPHQEVNFMVHHPTPSMINPYPHSQYCYIAQPCAVTVPYYATIPSYYSAPLPPQASVENEEHVPRFEPPLFFGPTERVGDYFSDENTMGCHVM